MHVLWHRNISCDVLIIIQQYNKLITIYTAYDEMITTNQYINIYNKHISAYIHMCVLAPRSSSPTSDAGYFSAEFILLDRNGYTLHGYNVS